MTSVASRRLLPLVFVAVGAGVYFSLGASWPKDQALRFVLGDAAPRVREILVQYREGAGGEPLRQVEFHYPPGQAPRIVSHEPRLRSGDYMVEVEAVVALSVTSAETARVAVERRILLEGGTVTVDLSRPLLQGNGAR